MVTSSTPPESQDALAQAEAVLDWWRLAGVTVDTVDEAQGWLDAETAKPASDVTEKPVIRKKTPPPKKLVGGERIQIEQTSAVPQPEGGLPATLPDFQSWWGSEKKSSGGATLTPVMPRGIAGAELCFLVPQPEKEDRDALLQGPRGVLFAAIMRAMGLDETQCYLASVLPAHVIQPDWDALHAAGHGQITRHHLALAAPKRIIVFGRRILPLIAHESAQDPADLREFNHEGISVPLMAAPELGSLLRSAGQRKRFWQQWLEWTDNR